MKKIKYILFSAVAFSFLFITACSTTQNVPQDDVYYSTTPHRNNTAKTTTAVASAANRQNRTKNYHEGTVEDISTTSGQASSGSGYNVDYAARLKKLHQSNDTSFNAYNNNYANHNARKDSLKKSKSAVSANYTLNLGFGSPYFGSSWSFGFGPFYGWDMGFGWGYPDWGWGYPGWGWGYPDWGWSYPGWGWGYPYYGFYPPYYGFYSPYYDYYAPYYGYYPPYFPVYPVNGSVVYQPRIQRRSGSTIPYSRSLGSSGVYMNLKNAKVAGRRASVVASGKRVPVNPEGKNGKMVKPNGNNSRPVGSMRYSAELAKLRSEEIRSQGKLNKPGGGGVTGRNPAGNRSSRFGISESRNRMENFQKPPAFRQEENMPRPRFRKPKQYQSLGSRSARSSREFYRAPVRYYRPNYEGNRFRIGGSHPQPIRRQNIFRLPSTRDAVYRGNRSRSGVKVYNAPSRSFYSPNIFRAPVRRNPSFSAPSRSFSAPTRTFSAPVRTGSSTGGGGGGIRRSSGSGGIRR